MTNYRFTAAMWLHECEAAWFFVTLPDKDIRRRESWVGELREVRLALHDDP